MMSTNNISDIEFDAGSHRLGMLQHVDTESHLGLDPSTWTFDKALPVEGQAGDAIFFHVKTIHGSPPNHTNQPRPVFIHRYRAANDLVVIGGTSTANRTQAQQRQTEATKENQLGFMVRGLRK
jgi:ectoine hydroxylase-related dioxygenase (phytanoyl-CoA dioxygenase family)